MDAFSIFSPLVSSQKRRVYSPQSTVAFQICPPKNHHIRLKDPPTKLLQMLSTFRTSFLSIIIGPSLLRTIEREFVLRGGVVKAAGCKAARRVIKIIRHQNTSRDQLAESLEDDWKGLRRYLPIACGAEEGGGGGSPGEANWEFRGMEWGGEAGLVILEIGGFKRQRKDFDEMRQQTHSALRRRAYLLRIRNATLYVRIYEKGSETKAERNKPSFGM